MYEGDSCCIMSLIWPERKFKSRVVSLFKKKKNIKEKKKEEKSKDVTSVWSSGETSVTVAAGVKRKKGGRLLFYQAMQPWVHNPSPLRDI